MKPARFATAVAALAVLLSAVGCGSDTPTSPPTDVPFAGTFTLRTVDAANLPYVLIQSGQNSTAVTSGAITIADGGTWSETANFQVRQNGQMANQAYVDSGVWVRSGDAIVLHSSVYDNVAYVGSFTTNRLTLVDPSNRTFVFSK